MSKGRLARQVGVLGNSFPTPLKGLLIFQIFLDYSLCSWSPILFSFSADDLFVVVRTLILGNPTSGWTSLMAVILFLGGIQLLTIGILGKYISKIYLETKKTTLSYQRKK